MRRKFTQTIVWRKRLLCASTVLLSGVFVNHAAYSQSATFGGLNPALIAPQGSTGTAPSSLNGSLNGVGQNQNPLPIQGQADNSRIPGFGLNQDRQANEAASQQGQAGGQQQAGQADANILLPANGVVPGAAIAGQGAVGPVAPQGVDQATVGSVITQQGGGGAVAQAPFDPLGIRAGRFILRPSLQSSVGYTSNSIQDAGGEGSAFVSSQASLAI